MDHQTNATPDDLLATNFRKQFEEMVHITGDPEQILHSETPEEYYYLFHDMFIANNIEIAFGVKIPTRQWAALCIKPFEFINILNDYVTADEHLQRIKLHILSWIVESKSNNSFDPISYFYPGIITPLNNAQEVDPQIEKIQEKLRAGKTWEQINKEEMEEIEKYPGPENSFNFDPMTLNAMLKFAKRTAMFRIFKEKCKQENDGREVDPRVVAAQLTKLTTTSEYVHVCGIPFSLKRYNSAFKKGDIAGIAYVLFDKHLTYRYLKIDREFIDFPSVCPVVRLAIYQCSKFLMNEKLQGVEKPREFDFQNRDCHVFPTTEECKAIDEYITRKGKERHEKQKRIKLSTSSKSRANQSSFDQILDNISGTSSIEELYEYLCHSAQNYVSVEVNMEEEESMQHPIIVQNVVQDIHNGVTVQASTGNNPIAGPSFAIIQQNPELYNRSPNAPMILCAITPSHPHYEIFEKYEYNTRKARFVISKLHAEIFTKDNLEKKLGEWNLEELLKNSAKTDEPPIKLIETATELLKYKIRQKWAETLALIGLNIENCGHFVPQLLDALHPLLKDLVSEVARPIISEKRQK